MAGVGGQGRPWSRRRRRAPRRCALRGPRPPTTSTPTARSPAARPRRDRARRGSRRWPDRGRPVTCPSVGEGDGPLHVDGHLGRDLVEARARAGGEEGITVLVDAHGPARRVGGVEERLGGGVGVGRTEDARAQPVAGDDVGLVQGEVGDELDRTARPVGGEFLAEPVQPGRHGQEAHVDGARRERGRARRRLRRANRRPESARRGSASPRREAPSALSAPRPSPPTGDGAGRPGPSGGASRPWRSTRTVRSLAATVAVVTTALCRATSAGRDAGSPKKSVVPRRPRVRGHGAAESRVVRVVGHDDHVRPGPRTRPRPASTAGARAPPHRGAAARHPARAATSQVPSASSPTGSASGTYGVNGILVSERARGPRATPVPSITGTNPAGASSSRLGQPERDAGRRTRRWPGPSGPAASVLQRPAQQAVGGLEGLERGDVREALQEGGRVDGVLRGRRA